MGISYVLCIETLLLLRKAIVLNNRHVANVVLLLAANTDHLAKLSPETDRWGGEGRFVGVNDGAFPDEVGSERTHETRAL